MRNLTWFEALISSIPLFLFGSRAFYTVAIEQLFVEPLHLSIFIFLGSMYSIVLALCIIAYIPKKKNRKVVRIKAKIKE